METILAVLNGIYPLSTGLREHLVKILDVKTIKRKDYLLQAGKTCDEICFIESGLLKSFYLEDGKEVNKWFMKEGDIAIAVQSFFKQIGSIEFIQAIEDTTIQFIRYKDLQYIYAHFQEFNFIGRIITEKYYCLLDERMDAIKNHTAWFRYQYMIKNYPELVKRVPAKDLASYLGMEKEHLSAIKNQR
jgi:CRP/FNR family transcriptional regulator, anaerobic regulatory protein